jgi:DNA polymerase-3 subunit beta
MKFTCERDTLLKEVSAASDIIASKQVISILSNIYIEAENDTLLIKATDVKVNFSTKIPVSVTETGSTTVPGSKLLTILSSMPVGEVEFEHNDGKMTLKSSEKKIKFQLKSLASDKFPVFPSSGDAKFFELPIADFKEMITQTIFAVTDDQTRPVMTGVLLEKSEGKLIMVATDGRRLSYAENELGDVIEDFQPVILPVKALNVILKRGGGEGPISLCITDNVVFMNFGAYNLSSQLLEGQFPNYRRVIPTDHQYSFIANRVEVLDAVRRAAPMLAEHQKIMRVFLNITSGGISITTEENDIGTMEEEIPCQYEGEDAQIVFNNRYLEEPLKVIETDDVKFTFTDTGKAIMVKAEPDKDYFHIVMPMQV